MSNAEKVLAQAVIEMLRQGANRSQISTIVARTIANVACGKISTDRAETVGRLHY